MPVAARGGCGTRRPSTNPNNETTESTFMEKINAVITGVGGYVPEYVLNNDELSRMVDTNDEWIMTRIGIKERRILNEEGLGTSYMARKAVKQLLQKTAPTLRKWTASSWPPPPPTTTSPRRRRSSSDAWA